MVNSNMWAVTNIFTEFRFQTTTKFFSSKEELLKALVNKYPNYNLEKLDQLDLHSQEIPGVSITISPNRFVLNYEDGTDIADFVKETRRVWEIVNKSLQVKIVNRIGIRGYFIRNMSVENANKSIISMLSNDIDKTALQDAQLSLTFKEGESFIKISISNASVQTVQLGIANVPPITAQGLLVDSDFFSQNVFSHKVNETLTSSANITNKYLDFCCGRI